MSAKAELDRQAPCPNCGAPMTFRFGSAHSQVCKYCKFLVARTDRGLEKRGQVADLLELPSPLAVGVTGTWGGQRFEVAGRVQLDRVGVASAPWQEFYLVNSERGFGFWVAYAQGRWYSTQAVVPTPQIPPFQSLRPGQTFHLAPIGPISIAEVGQRRVLSAEGELPEVAPPGGITAFADFGAAGNVFGTLDYGDGRTLKPAVFAGRQFDPNEFKLDGGASLDKPAAQVRACACPQCGGSLPIHAPETAERIICRYCGAVSDVRAGALSMLGQAPKPPIEPFIPIGAEGVIRQKNVVVVGFVQRSTQVDGEYFSWREYLLFAGRSGGYAWIIEEDGAWQFALPIPPGEAIHRGATLQYGGKSYAFKEQVVARVEYVVGEFYWKVSVGEAVEVGQFVGPLGTISVEKEVHEVNYSLCYPMTAREIGEGFRIAPPPERSFSAADTILGSGTQWSTLAVWGFVILIILLVLSLDVCSGDDGGTGSDGTRVYVGPGFGGK